MTLVFITLLGFLSKSANFLLVYLGVGPISTFKLKTCGKFFLGKLDKLYAKRAR